MIFRIRIRVSSRYPGPTIPGLGGTARRYGPAVRPDLNLTPIQAEGQRNDRIWDYNPLMTRGLAGFFPPGRHSPCQVFVFGLQK